ncbi:MAG: glycosyltransferase family 4 protein [Candidatus Aureabacteria bacterium]|nr:glycosyltransferase family 4 protein [Candidatus Auribacterota bacterium]
MRIAFDARYIEKEGSGVSVYASHLLYNLFKTNDIEIITISAPDQDINGLCNIDTENISCPYGIQNHPMQEYWLSFKLPHFLKEKKADILFCPAFIVPLKKLPIKLGVTIHDFVFRFAPTSMNRRFALYAKFMTNKAVKLSDFIITDTKAIKDELIDLYEKDPKKVYHVHPGKTFRTFKESKDNSNSSKNSLNALGIRKPYFLFVGNLEPRKDISRLINLFQRLRKKSEFSDHLLVLCGKKRWQWNKIEPDIKNNLENVFFTGYVEQEHLEGLYKGCKAVFATSFYEGFGFPVLEGMQAGKIVFASSIPTFREIGGKGAVYLDLSDLGASEGIISDTLKNEEKMEIIKKASEKRLDDFSWEESAKKTIDIFKKSLIF